MDVTFEIYDLLGVSPEAADKKALSLLQSAQTTEEVDAINWARGYALVELKRFSEALDIWQDIFKRTQNHKALHQIGFVQRSAGQLTQALDTFTQEQAMIAGDDTLAIAVNLYEHSYCSFLCGDIPKAQELLHRYENLKFEETDLIERGCFFRLKGDIYTASDKDAAKSAYQQSLQFFKQAQDEISTLELQQKISAL